MSKSKEGHETLSMQQLKSKIDWLKTSVQLANATLKICNRYTMCANDREQILNINFELDSKIYDKLNQPVKQYDQLQKFVQHKQIHSAMGQLYEFFTNYLHDIINEISKYRPQTILTLLKDEHCNNITLTMAQIKASTTITDIKKQVLDIYFEKLQSTQHTQDLYNKLISHTGITISSQVQWRGMGFMTFRNLLVHNRGYISDDFEKKYKGIIHESFRSKIATGKELPLEMEILNDACDAIYTLCKSIDNQLMEKDLVKSRLVK